MHAISVNRGATPIPASVMLEPIELSRTAPLSRIQATPWVVSTTFRDCDCLSPFLNDPTGVVVQSQPGPGCGNSVTVAFLRTTRIFFGNQGVPCLSHATSLKDHLTFLVPLSAGAALHYNGVPVDLGNLAVYGPDALHTGRSAGPAEYAYQSIPVQVLAQYPLCSRLRQIISGQMPFLLCRPPAHHWTAFIQLLQEVRRACLNQPESLASPAARAQVESALIDGFLSLTASSEVVRESDSVRQANYRKVVAESLQFLGGRMDVPFYIAQLCDDLKVSERTLQMAFRNLLGMGPIKYFKLRRMREARRALRHAYPASSTVKEIALSFGFWDLGRFSVEYRQLFGESPSETLEARRRARLPAAEPEPATTLQSRIELAAS